MTPLTNDFTNPDSQGENLRQAFSLLEAIPATTAAKLTNFLSGAFDVNSDIDPFLFIDIAVNGTALEMLQLLSVDTGDFTEMILEVAEDLHDEHYDEETETDDEEWDTATQSGN